MRCAPAASCNAIRASIRRASRSASGAGCAHSTRCCGQATGSRSIVRCRSTRKKRGGCASASRPTLFAIGGDDVARALGFVGALLVVEKFAFAFLVGPDDADAAVERAHLALGAGAVFGPCRRDLGLFGLDLGRLLGFGLLALGFEFGFDGLERESPGRRNRWPAPCGQRGGP